MAHRGPVPEAHPFGPAVGRLVDEFARLPGIGRKTAERLIVEMKDRLSEWGSELQVSFPDAPVLSGAGERAISQEAETALISLGYKPQEAARMIAQVLKADGAISKSEDIIRQALRNTTTS